MGKFEDWGGTGGGEERVEAAERGKPRTARGETLQLR